MRNNFSLVLCLLLLSCSGNYKTLDEGAGDYGQSDSEKHVIKHSEEIRQEYESKGMIMTNDEVSNYVSQLGASLVTSQASSAVKFHFYVLRSPQVNAFATANGDVFINLGLITRMENELQLAQVISHEVGHVVKRHVYQAYESKTTSAKAAHFLDLALFGTKLGYLPFAASMSSYDRDKEREADQYSIERLSAVGYDINKADGLFLVLSEVKKGDAVEGSVWSDHPSDNERKENIKTLVASGKYQTNAGGKTNSAQFNIVRSRAILQNLELKILYKQYSLAAESAEQELKRNPNNAAMYYYDGEAYRKMAEDPEGLAAEYAWINGTSYSEKETTKFAGRKQEFLASALIAFNQSIALNPDYANSYKGRGLTKQMNGNKSAAIVDLRTYLSKSGNQYDKRYINRIIEDLSK